MSRSIASIRLFRSAAMVGLSVAVGLASTFLAAMSEPKTQTIYSMRDTGSDDDPFAAIPAPPEADPARVALGRDLFFDLRLSRGGDRSCATCHDLATNGASERAKDVTADGVPLKRNTPTVFNAGLSYRLDWEGDAASLAEQAERALFSSEFMEENWPHVLGKLRKDRDLSDRFRHAFGRDPDRENVLNSIAIFEMTLLTPSRFDRWLRGDIAALSPDESAGYKLFRTIGCAACHQGVNVGGNLLEKVGVFGPLLGKPRDTLRVPSLRNVAVTPPYFDDGSAATLQEAVKQMAKVQLGFELSDQQNKSIVAFLASLTGTYQGRQLSVTK